MVQNGVYVEIRHLHTDMSKLKYSSSQIYLRIFQGTKKKWLQKTLEKLRANICRVPGKFSLPSHFVFVSQRGRGFNGLSRLLVLIPSMFVSFIKVFSSLPELLCVPFTVFFSFIFDAQCLDLFDLFIWHYSC